MKVYDCFTFYNEFELLELRLKSLWDVVDYFVLVEADRTQSNIPKPFYFNERKSEFVEFLPKIRHLMGRMELPYKGVGDWSIEHAQRDLIAQGLQDAQPDDLVFISDVDEFPTLDILQRINNHQAPLIAQYTTPPLSEGRRFNIPCRLMVDAIDLLEVGPVALNQVWHYYYLDWATKVQQPTTIIVKRRNLTTPQEIRNLLHYLPRIPDAGWHLSYMGGAERVINKIKAIVEGDQFIQSNKKLTDKNYIEQCMTSGADIYGRKGIPESQFYPYDISNIKLPYLQEFVKKYPYFLRPKD